MLPPPAGESCGVGAAPLLAVHFPIVAAVVTTRLKCLGKSAEGLGGSQSPERWRSLSPVNELYALLRSLSSRRSRRSRKFRGTP